MSAPEGNNFWTKRHKHGRDMLFATPEALLEAAAEYFKHVDDNPFIESKPMVVSKGEGLGSSIEMSETPVIKPYTMTGLCLYLHCSESYFRTFKATQEDRAEDFLTVIEHIKQTIYNQKFSGASSGFFNANIISRDLGLKDHSDVTTDGQKMNQVLIIPDTVANKLLNDLDNSESKDK